MHLSKGRFDNHSGFPSVFLKPLLDCLEDPLDLSCLNWVASCRIDVSMIFHFPSDSPTNLLFFQRDLC